jgi:hypothetical protein
MAEQNLFFIPSIPDNAEFIGNTYFAKLPCIEDEVQMVDPRYAKPLEPIEDVPYILRIKDMQISQRSAEVLCSICIFKRDDQSKIAAYGQPFSDYLDGLKNWVEYIKKFPRRKLRVHVGNSVWDILHREGILKNRHIDFIRMESSSSWSVMGVFWRFLAFDDYSCDYVYVDDTDRWDETRRPMGMTRLTRKMGDSSKFHFSGALKLLSRHDRSWKNNEISLFHTVSVGGYNDSIVNHASRYFSVHELAATRGPKPPPFDNYLPYFKDHWTKADVCLLYCPSLNLFTRCVNDEWGLKGWRANINWHFYLSKLLKLRYYITPDSRQLLENVRNKYGDNFFWVRLYKQFIDEGNSISCGENSISL